MHRRTGIWCSPKRDEEVDKRDQREGFHTADLVIPAGLHRPGKVQDKIHEVTLRENPTQARAEIPPAPANKIELFPRLATLFIFEKLSVTARVTPTVIPAKTT